MEREDAVGGCVGEGVGVEAGVQLDRAVRDIDEEGEGTLVTVEVMPEVGLEVGVRV